MNKLIIGLVVLILHVIVGFQVAKYTHKETFIVTVTGKERIVESNGESTDSYYLIYTEDGTYKLEDELLYGNFRSSDWYGKIRVDSTYEFTTIGFRIGFISEYPNIIKIN